MIFRGGLHLKVLNGRKSEVRRPVVEGETHCRYRIGNEYVVERPHPEADKRNTGRRIQVLGVDRQRLGNIADESIRREGFKTPSDYRAFWTEHHGPWKADMEVWVIVFALVDDPVLLLARQSENGYTHDPRMALADEPEAVPPAEIASYRASREAKDRFDKLHSEERARANIRSAVAKIRNRAIKQVRAGRDPTTALEQFAQDLEDQHDDGLASGCLLARSRQSARGEARGLLPPSSEAHRPT